MSKTNDMMWILELKVQIELNDVINTIREYAEYLASNIEFASEIVNRNFDPATQTSSTLTTLSNEIEDLCNKFNYEYCDPSIIPTMSIKYDNPNELSEKGEQIFKMVSSDDLAQVNQGLMLLEGLKDDLSILFYDGRTDHTMLDFFRAYFEDISYWNPNVHSIPNENSWPNEHLIFEDFYDEIYDESVYEHRVPILEFILQHDAPSLTWTEDLDAYLRMGWSELTEWPERKALTKTILNKLEGPIDDTFMMDLKRIRRNSDTSIMLITDDFQLIACSSRVMTTILKQYPTHPLLIKFLHQSLENKLMDYSLSLLYTQSVKKDVPKDFLQSLVCTLNPESKWLHSYHWLREMACSNSLFTIDELTLLTEFKDRYILKGISQNPNCSDDLRVQIAKKLEDETEYPVTTHSYTLSANYAAFGDHALMGLDELSAYCLRIKDGIEPHSIEPLRLSEGKQIEQGNWFIHNIEHAWFEGFGKIALEDVNELSEVKSEHVGQEGWLLLGSVLHSNCDYDDSSTGTVYFEFELEYPLDINQIKWYTDEFGKWGAEYKGTMVRAQEGDPMYDGGYATSLKLFIDGEWKELPYIIGSSWYESYLLEECDVDTSSETAHADMKAWLLKNHPDLKQAINSIHTVESSNASRNES